jgi:hypothetical protein
VVANRNTESEDDFIRMQQEAIRRVREMQSRARATLENAGMHIENDNDYPDAAAHSAPAASAGASAPGWSADDNHATAKNPVHNEAHVSTQHQTQPNQQPREREIPHIPNIPHEPHRSEQPGGLNLQGLNISLDTDQLMLMATIYLLIKDGADKWLILSLAYILLA